MATAQTRIDRAMRLNSVSVSQYTPAMQIEDTNVIYHQIEDFIVSEIWEGFFWDILQPTTTVVWQSEYNFPTWLTWNFNSANKIEAISIKYTSTSSYVPAREVNRQIYTQQNDLTVLATQQPVSDPIYFIADNSIFIYPTPLEAVTNWINWYGIKSLADITASTTDANMFNWKIPLKYYYMLSDWLAQFILATKVLKQESEIAKDIFEKKTLRSLINKLWNRKTGIQLRQSPDLSSLHN